MTDQFTPEYIAYILSDEAKGLQPWIPNEWSPGDWVTWDGDVHLVVVTEPSDDRIDLIRLGHTKIIPWHIGWEQRHRWRRLATLWDLLQIIEGAGYQWKLETLITRSYPGLRYYVEIQNHETEMYFDVIERDLMLAAAKLAVRAIES